MQSSNLVWFLCVVLFFFGCVCFRGKMRIRKNMKLSSMLLATAGNGGDKLETYVCPLNQSPWDVIPLTSSLDDDDDGAAELTNLIDSSWFLPSPSSSSHLVKYVISFVYLSILISLPQMSSITRVCFFCPKEP